MWTNPLGESCQEYETNGWCSNGKPTAKGKAEGGFGQGFNFPENNCKACGADVVDRPLLTIENAKKRFTRWRDRESHLALNPSFKVNPYKNTTCGDEGCDGSKRNDCTRCGGGIPRKDFKTAVVAFENELFDTYASRRTKMLSQLGKYLMADGKKSFGRFALEGNYLVTFDDGTRLPPLNPALDPDPPKYALQYADKGTSGYGCKGCINYRKGSWGILTKAPGNLALAKGKWLGGRYAINRRWGNWTHRADGKIELQGSQGHCLDFEKKCKTKKTLFRGMGSRKQEHLQTTQMCKPNEKADTFTVRKCQDAPSFQFVD